MYGNIFFGKEYRYRVDAANISSNYDFDGAIYFGETEVGFASRFGMDGLSVFLRAIPPGSEATTEDFLVYQCQFERIVRKNPKTKYQLDPNLIGCWRNADRYSSSRYMQSFGASVESYLDLPRIHHMGHQNSFH